MKKTLSILLALTMLFALCVPSFAANPITQTTESNGTTTLQTDTTEFTTTDGYYSVTFPATQNVKWGVVSTNLDCTVYANLMNNKKISVNVTATDPASVMKDAAAHTILFTLGTNVYTAANSFVNNATWQPTVDITTAAWDAAPIGVYEANLTFAVTVA